MYKLLIVEDEMNIAYTLKKPQNFRLEGNLFC